MKIVDIRQVNIHQIGTKITQLVEQIISCLK